MRAERARPAPAITPALREELVQRSVVPEPQLPLGKAPCAAGSHVPIPQWTLGNSSSANHWCKKKSATLAQVKLSFVSSAPNAPPFHWQKKGKYTKGSEMPRTSPSDGPKATLATLAPRPNQAESSHAGLITSNHSKRNKSQLSHRAWGVGKKGEESSAQILVTLFCSC